jgi:hypothetical protein
MFPELPGWLLSEDAQAELEGWVVWFDRKELGITVIGEDSQFATTSEARRFVAERAAEGSPLHQRALEFIERYRK